MPEPKRPLRRGVGCEFDHGQPLSQPFYGPVAAIWLVSAALALLGSYPLPTHALLIDLPVPSAPYEGTEPLPAIQAIAVGVEEDGQPLWQGKHVTLRQVVDLANAARNGSRQPHIVFEPHPEAGFEASLRVLAILAQSGLTRVNFCFGGLEEHASFGRGAGSALPALALMPPLPTPSAPPPPEYSMQPSDWTETQDCMRAEAMLR